MQYTKEEMEQIRNDFAEMKRDYDDLFKMYVKENRGSYQLNEIVDNFIEEVEELYNQNEEAFRFYAEENGINEAIDNFEDQFMGEYRNSEDFGREEASSLFNIPREIEFYVDFEAFGEALLNDYQHFEGKNGRLYVFRG
jgi:antirestriction protein